MSTAEEITYVIHNPREEADQIPLVLIHGAGGSYLSWPPEIRRLPGYRIYGLNLPGHGKASGTGRQSISAYMMDLFAWMDRIGLDKAVLIGHSMGSAIALTLALEHPQRVLGLILLGAGARLRVHPDILNGIADQVTFYNTIDIIVAWIFASQAPPRLVELAHQRMQAIQPAILLGDLIACDGFDVFNRLGEISRPSLVICGEEDRMTPIKYAQFLANHINDAKLEVIPGGGHMIMLEKPHLVRNSILRFLKTISDRESD